MSYNTGTDTILRVVHDWWLAWQQKDHGALERLAVEEYVEFTGHSSEPRISRSVLLGVAARAFDAFTILNWEIVDSVIRRETSVAVVMYRWSDIVEHDGERRSRSGVATDVLVDRGAGWRYLAHHNSMFGSTEL